MTQLAPGQKVFLQMYVFIDPSKYEGCSLTNTAKILQAPGGTENLIVLEVCYERIPVEPFREPPGAESSAKSPNANRPDEG